MVCDWPHSGKSAASQGGWETKGEVEMKNQNWLKDSDGNITVDSWLFVITALIAAIIALLT